MNPHEKLAMEFFSPPGPSARRWRFTSRNSSTFGEWIDGAVEPWPSWSRFDKYEIELKPQTITLPERTIPKPLDVGELVEGTQCWVVNFFSEDFTPTGVEFSGSVFHATCGKRGFMYPHTDQGRADAIAAAKGMCNWRDEG